MLTTLAGSSQTSPTYWLNPQTGVSYPVSVQTPQRDIGTMGGLQNMPLTPDTGTGADSQLLVHRFLETNHMGGIHFI
jgi:hypothetical protein